MDKSEFESKYWRYYIMLENRLIETFDYVEYCEKNYPTFSLRFADLLLSIGSEVDHFMKMCCGYRVGDRPDIKDYSEKIPMLFPTIRNEVARVQNFNKIIRPYAKWDQANPSGTLRFWNKYNNLKHNRNLENASLLTVMEALSGLYILEIMYYRDKVFKDNSEDLFNIPDDCSRLFDLEGFEIYSPRLQNSSFMRELDEQMMNSDDSKFEISIDNEA